MSDHAAVVGWLADWPHRLPTDPLPDTARHACAERVRQAVCAVAAGESVGPLAGGNALRQLVVLKGRQYVSLGYLAPADAMRAPEAERFFRSLRLLS